MSRETEPKPYLYKGESESPCGSMSHLHRMGVASEGSDSSRDPLSSPRPQAQMHEEVEMGGSGSSGSGTESHSNESHSNESHGNESVGSSSGNGKDSAIMASSGSNKSSNSQSFSPPSSNNAFSLVSSELDNPSTSGCSSEQSAKAKTQKELFKTLKELKYHLPPDKRSKGRASTLHTLRYALRCVKEVKANEEYYQMLMINDSQPSGLDVSSYTIEEINSITSEYTLKNADIFAAAVSLITGKIMYISEQAAGILNCRKDEFKDRKFVEFLTPRDVSVFYSFTTPYRLPSWSMCTGTESSTEFMQEKSFFCRISGGKEKEGDLQYYPFRLTPYLMKVQESELSEEHFCCLILAERVHSGYEAPRIPPDKRIFTTTHTPNCVFQDVDERAVPLLGFLPQDLIGTSLLLHLHPSDRPIMLAVHRKILQYVGQPFDHSSIRFCVRNGEYITLDTSWCSFVNPWSRKVSFVIGRHKVCMGPINEDVFSAPAFTEEKIMDSDIQEITEQIERLLLQPVHSMGSSGYGSHGSSGSHEHPLSIASSSDSNGNGNTANSGSKINGNTRREEGKSKPVIILLSMHILIPELTLNNSISKISVFFIYLLIFYSCNVSNTVKRKYQFSSNTTSSNSDEDKNASDASLQQTNGNFVFLGPAPGRVIGGPLSPLDLASKADSVVSQCSYSSTIVHVGDKKTQPESGTGSHTLSQKNREAYKKLGLTKQVLAAHTQKEEQAFLSRCRELRSGQARQKDCPLSTQRNQGKHSRGCGPSVRSTCRSKAGAGVPVTQATTKKIWRTKKSKKARTKHPDSSDNAASQHRPLPPLHGLNQTSWSPSETSQSGLSVPFTNVVPGYPLYPVVPSVAPPQAPTGVAESKNTQATPSTATYPTPLATPVVAFVLPGFVLPQIGTAPRSPFCTQQTHTSFTSQQPTFTPQTHFQYGMASDPKHSAIESTERPSPLPPSQSPQVFESRCSSPLQLNLLQMEEKQESHTTAPQSSTQGNCSLVQDKNNTSINSTASAINDLQQAFCLGNGGHCDDQSSSSSVLDLLLQEDSHSGMGSAMSAFTGSTSNDCNTNSGTGSNTSKYFGSVDSSENSHKSKDIIKEQEKDFKYVLQEPVWRFTANDDDCVMMTYQVPSRDMEKVLGEDQECLRRMQKNQPRFSSEQRRELIDQHPWMRRGSLPNAINDKVEVEDMGEGRGLVFGQIHDP
uniref:Period circadian protein homolog 2 n=1 Tax=Cyprinus carpio carpio TaxID=630221 RepID=A0A9J7ZJ44_CYPCA